LSGRAPPERKTLYIVGQDWRGPDALAQAGPTGQVVAIDVEVAGVGWP
jgi:sugar lactone lactonase YvrE